MSMQYKTEVADLQDIEVFSSVDAVSECLGYDFMPYLI